MKKKIVILLAHSLFLIPSTIFSRNYILQNQNNDCILYNSVETGCYQIEYLNILLSAGKNEIVINSEDNNPCQIAWSIIYIYSIDGLDLMGPYVVNEGEPLTVEIDDKDWSVRVFEQSPESTVSWSIVLH